MTIKVFIKSQNASVIVQLIWKRGMIVKLVPSLIVQPVRECMHSLIENRVLLRNDGASHSMALPKTCFTTKNMVKIVFVPGIRTQIVNFLTLNFLAVI